MNVHRMRYFGALFSHGPLEPAATHLMPASLFLLFCFFLCVRAPIQKRERGLNETEGKERITKTARAFLFARFAAQQRDGEPTSASINNLYELLRPEGVPQLWAIPPLWQLFISCTLLTRTHTHTWRLDLKHHFICPVVLICCNQRFFFFLSKLSSLRLVWLVVLAHKDVFRSSNHTRLSSHCLPCSGWSSRRRNLLGPSSWSRGLSLWSPWWRRMEVAMELDLTQTCRHEYWWTEATYYQWDCTFLAMGNYIAEIIHSPRTILSTSLPWANILWPLELPESVFSYSFFFVCPFLNNPI